MSLWISGIFSSRSKFHDARKELTALLQVCQFCFNNIKNNMNGLCPACRRPYDEKTIEWKVVTSEEYDAVFPLSLDLVTNVIKTQSCSVPRQHTKEPKEACTRTTAKRSSEARSRERESQKPCRCSSCTKEPGLHHRVGSDSA